MIDFYIVYPLQLLGFQASFSVTIRDSTGDFITARFISYITEISSCSKLKWCIKSPVFVYYTYTSCIFQQWSSFHCFLFSYFSSMEKKQFTKIMLVFMFVGFYLWTLLVLTFNNGKLDLWILKMIPILFLVWLISFIRRRFKEKWEHAWFWWIVWILLLLLIPFINLIILYDLIKDKKAN